MLLVKTNRNYFGGRTSVNPPLLCLLLADTPTIYIYSKSKNLFSKYLLESFNIDDSRLVVNHPFSTQRDTLTTV